MPIAAPCAATWRAWSPAAASARRPNSGPNSTTTCAPLSRPAGRPGIFLSHRRQPGTRWPALPAGRAHRGRQPAHRAALRPRRRGARLRRAMARRPVTLDPGRGRRALVRARHGRQQGPVLHQRGRAGTGVGRARRAPGLQRPHAGRMRRGSRLARPARGLRPVARRLEGRRLHRIGRPAPGGGPAHAVPRFARHAAVRPGSQSAQPRASLGQLGRRAAQPRADPGARAGQPGRRARPPASRRPAPATHPRRRARWPPSRSAATTTRPKRIRTGASRV